MNPTKSPSFPPNASPSLAWGSPALRSNASFPRMCNTNTPPYQSPQQSGRCFAGPRTPSRSPQFHRGSPYHNHSSFRTPQPHSPHQSPNTPKGSWSDGKEQRGQRSYRGNNSWQDSPRNSPNVNPGGSDNIQVYYNPDMVNDPWQNTPPQPTNHWRH